MESLVVWLPCLAAATAIFYAGRQLSHCGDVIAEKTKVSRGWIGFILLALITSLPEVSTSLSSASLLQSPDLAIGNLVGSNIFNLLIIVLLDLLYSPSPILTVAGEEHNLSLGLGILLGSLTILGLLTQPDIGFLGVNLVSWGILIVYLIGVRLSFKNSKQPADTTAKYPEAKLSHTYFKFILFSVIIIGSGIMAAYSGRDIARITGLSYTLVGTFFLAIVTSLPEVAVAVGALKLGEPDMALGNLFGSNVFNLSLVFLVDVFYRAGGIFSGSSGEHIITVVEFLILSGIVLISLSCKSRKQFLRLGVDSLCILGVYLLGVFLLIMNKG